MTRLQFLGTGWSHGVPVIGCSCSVCTGGHPYNQRRRPSIHLQSGNTSFVVDVGPDFRTQVLDYKVSHLDAVFITHAHADHVMGIDDLRRFTWEKEQPLPVYADAPTCGRLQELLPYAASVSEPGKAVPQILFHPWNSSVQVGSVQVTPFQVPHGGMSCCGLRIDSPDGSIGYVPDCNDLTEEAKSCLEGVEVMILNALRIQPHPHHLSLEQSLALLRELNAPVSLLTHLGCPIDYPVVQPTLQEGFHLAVDGMEISLSPEGTRLALPPLENI